MRKIHLIYYLLLKFYSSFNLKILIFMNLEISNLAELLKIINIINSLM